MTHPLPIDVVIFGGGAAGLWLLDDLVRQGFSALVLEAHELGHGQTIASQGIIHGGMKYTLSGIFTPSAKAIRLMPMVWRRCLAGQATPNLTATRVRAEYCHIWRTGSVRSKLAMIGARAGLRIKPRRLEPQDRPSALMDCPGTVARLDEQVIDPGSFLADLGNQHPSRILKIDAGQGLEFIASHGEVQVVRLTNPETGESLELKPGIVVLAAGEGNEALRKHAGLPAGGMQRRPLHMVMARKSAGHLPVLNGHCVDGSATRATITSTTDFGDRIVWQIGGQIAERGVNMQPDQLVYHAWNELRAVLPSVDFDRVEWATYRVDRAELKTRGNQRPEDVFANREGNVITAWPTKLALVPQLSREVRELIGGKPHARIGESETLGGIANWPRAVVALPPWETTQQWFRDV